MRSRMRPRGGAERRAGYLLRVADTTPDAARALFRLIAPMCTELTVDGYYVTPPPDDAAEALRRLAADSAKSTKRRRDALMAVKVNPSDESQIGIASVLLPYTIHLEAIMGTEVIFSVDDGLGSVFIALSESEFRSLPEHMRLSLEACD